MAFDVTTFRNNFNKRKGLAHPAYFTFEMDGRSELTLKIRKAQIPDQLIQTYQHSYNGIPIKYPWENSTSDINLEIICSADMYEHRVMTNWQRLAINYSTEGNGATFTVGYHKEYTKDANLYLYTNNMEKSMKYHFTEMWPTQVHSVELDWASKDQIMTFGVTMSYSHWSYETL